MRSGPRNFLIIVAVIVVVAFLVLTPLGANLYTLIFGGPAAPAPAGAEFKDQLKSITGAAGSTTTQVSGDGQSGSLTDTAAHFAAQPTTVLHIVITQTAPPGAVQANHRFQVTVDDPHFTSASTGLSYQLVAENPSNNCPLITYAVEGGTGNGAATQTPCGFEGSMGTNEQVALSMTLTMGSAFFLNAPTPSQWGLVIHVNGASDVTVVWAITS